VPGPKASAGFPLAPAERSALVRAAKRWRSEQSLLDTAGKRPSRQRFADLRHAAEALQALWADFDTSHASALKQQTGIAFVGRYVPPVRMMGAPAEPPRAAFVWNTLRLQLESALVELHGHDKGQASAVDLSTLAQQLGTLIDACHQIEDQQPASAVADTQARAWVRVAADEWAALGLKVSSSESSRFSRVLLDFSSNNPAAVAEYGVPHVSAKIIKNALR
jgi:hypothetical protein